MTIPNVDPQTDHQQVELERICRLPLADRGAQPTHVFDLTGHEQRRLAAVLSVTPDLDPGVVLAAEAEAHRMLYSGLDDEQRDTYRLFVDAGVFDA